LNTAFALIALMAGKYPNEEPIRRGIQLIVSRQLTTGEWKAEYATGIINNMTVTFSAYKFIFPIWALGMYAKIYNNPIIF
ncbi:9091_t:CDS:2, partial [Cetraspora pellucida]